MINVHKYAQIHSLIFKDFLKVLFFYTQKKVPFVTIKLLQWHIFAYKSGKVKLREITEISRRCTLQALGITVSPILNQFSEVNRRVH
jgi:hypothetical protein